LPNLIPLGPVISDKKTEVQKGVKWHLYNEK